MGASEWLAWRRESRSQSEPNEPRGCGSKECVLSFQAQSVSTPRRPQEPGGSNPSRGGRLSASQGKQKDSCLVGSYGARSTGTSRRLTVALSRLSAVSNRRLRATAYPSLNSHWFLCHKCPSRFPSQLTPVLPSEADAMPSSPLSLLQLGRILSQADQPWSSCIETALPLCRPPRTPPHQTRSLSRPGKWRQIAY